MLSNLKESWHLGIQGMRQGIESGRVLILSLSLEFWAQVHALSGYWYWSYPIDTDPWSYPWNFGHETDVHCDKVLILSFSLEFWTWGRYTPCQGINPEPVLGILGTRQLHIPSGFGAGIYPINIWSKLGIHPVFLIPIHPWTSLLCKLYYNSHAFNLLTIFMPHLQNMGYALKVHKSTFWLRVVQWRRR